MSLTKIEEIDVLIDRVQRQSRARRLLTVLLMVAMGLLAAYFVWQIWPRRYVLNASGGEVLSQRNYLMRRLSGESDDWGVDLLLEPTSGSLETLDLLSRKQLDVAMVLGGLNTVHPGVEHVATVDIEPLQLLVRPGIKSLQDLRGKRVNTGPDREGAWSVARAVLEFANLHDRFDYARTRLSDEELTGLTPDRLPEAVFVLSAVPSPLAQFLVRQRGYELLEIPFPPALALRHGWVADVQILAYSYKVNPPVPLRDLHTVGVRTYLVSREGVDPRAIQKLLMALYSPDLNRLLRQPIDPKNVLDAPVYPVSAGTENWLHRDQTFLSIDTVNEISQKFGAALSMVGFLLAVRRWLRGPPKTPKSDDEQFRGYVTQLAALERSLAETGKLAPPARQAQVQELELQLSGILVTVLEQLPTAHLADPNLITTLLQALRSTREHIHHLLRM